MVGKLPNCSQARRSRTEERKRDLWIRQSRLPTRDQVRPRASIRAQAAGGPEAMAVLRREPRRGAGTGRGCYELWWSSLKRLAIMRQAKARKWKVPRVVAS